MMKNVVDPSSECPPDVNLGLQLIVTVNMIPTSRGHGSALLGWNLARTFGAYRRLRKIPRFYEIPQPLRKSRQYHTRVLFCLISEEATIYHTVASDITPSGLSNRSSTEPQLITRVW